jgi:phage gp29-like protein
LIVAPVVHRESPADRRRWSQRYSTGLTPARLASIFAAADRGDLGPLCELLQELTKDDLIGALLDLRLGSLSQRDLDLAPAKTDPDPARAADVVAHCAEVLARLRLVRRVEGRTEDEGGLAEVVEAVDASVYFGMSLLWIGWVPGRDGLPVPETVELLDQRRYRTRPETGAVLLETAASYMGEPVGSFDPWCLQPAYGRSLSPRKEFAGVGRSVCFAWWLRQMSRLYSAQYAERFAVPAVVGSFAGSDVDQIRASFDADAREQLALFVESFASDAAAIFPPGFTAQILAAAPGGEKLFEYLDRVTRSAISTALLGQDGTSSGEGGSLAKAQVNELSRQDLIRKGGRRVASWVRRLLSYTVSLRWGPETPPPEVTFAATPEERAAEDRARIKAATELGLPVALDYALSALGLSVPADGAVLVDGSAWDGLAMRRQVGRLTGAELAKATGAAASPLVALLSGGVGVDVASFAAEVGIPLDPSRPAYTPPLQPGAAPADPSQVAAPPPQEPAP